MCVWGGGGVQKTRVGHGGGVGVDKNEGKVWGVHIIPTL